MRSSLAALREALDRARPSLKDLAEAIGVEPSMTSQYHARAHPPPSYVCRRLTSYLHMLSGELTELADALEVVTETVDDEDAELSEE